jgi:hypothetical protein
MLGNATPDKQATAGLPANNRSKISNRPQRMAISGRTALGRRVRDLAESFAVQLGGWSVLTDMQIAAVRRAAEHSRVAALRNGCADPLAFSRLEGCADRAVRRLGIAPPTKAKPARTIPSLAELIEGARRSEAAK